MNKLLTQYLPNKIKLSTDKIDCFLFDLNLFDEALAKTVLAEDELTRMARLMSTDKRKQFTISRALLRELLASCLVNTSPNNVEFHYAEHGKPSINYTQLGRQIEFNLSHTENYAMIALTLENQVGVDIESVSAKTEQAALVKRFFSEKEQNDWWALPKSDLVDAFFRCWTRKEAFIKAEGSGVSYGLDKFSVSLDKDMTSAKIELQSASDKTDWTNYSSITLKGYQTAIASKNGNLHISNHVITN